MEPTPFVILGAMLGAGALFLVQAYGRRKVRLASRSLATPERDVAILVRENERQLGQITRLEERIATLERIATDPAGRTAREIDALR
ncbi:MAG: hypothetical protein WC803_03810 [Sphingomonas sp.]|jgi:hypothetical protein